MSPMRGRTRVVVPPPDVADLLAYMTVDYPADQAQAALDAALEAQAARCVVDPYTQALFEAALRRAEALLVARSAPLGMLDAGPLGSMPLIRYDPKVDELEADHRRGAFA